MTTTRRATAEWYGALLDGSGSVNLDSSGEGEFPISWSARADMARGVTSPEELLAAAHAACFSMALASELAKSGTPPLRLQTTVEVDFAAGVGITGIRIQVRGELAAHDVEGFRAAAHSAKANCPVSRALRAVPITLTVLT